MSEYNFTKNTTIAFDGEGEILWSTEKTALGGGDFVMNAKEAVTIVLGQNVISISGSFASHNNVRNIYVYSQNIFDAVTTFYSSRYMKNESGEDVDVTLIDDISCLDFVLNRYDDSVFKNGENVYHVSSYGAIGDGETDDAPAINRAIDTVVREGGKLLFDGDKTYIIKSPILILPPEKTESNPIVHNFDIDFNGCTIKACTTTRTTDDNGEPIPEEPIMDFTSIIKLKKLMDVEGDEPIRSTLIYVHSGFAGEERIGFIQNVNLISEYYKKSDGTVVQIENGMYLEASPQISYKNIRIKDTQRGIYIKSRFVDVNGYVNNTVEVFMDNIHISKSLVDKTNPLDIPSSIAENIKIQNYPDKTDERVQECKYVGIDCRASDCHFSNITVEDYFVGMRLIGGDNRVYNAKCYNSHSPEQRGCSIGYINGGTNYYINCKVSDYFAGWMSYYAVPFFLNNCTWNVSRIDISAYKFYIAPSYYSGGGIYALDCKAYSKTTEGSNLNLCYFTDNNFTGKPDINVRATEVNSNNEN